MTNKMQGRSLNAIWMVVTASLCWATGAAATETQHFAYNARGELRSVARSGGTNDGFKSAYTLNSAANRSRVVARDVRVWLGAGASIWSQDGRFQLIMQTDGNLVLYGPTGALWWTSSNGPGRTMLFQSDGNVVVYGPTGPVWAINQQNWGAEMTLQNDGNLVIRAEDGRIVWQTGAGGH